MTSARTAAAAGPWPIDPDPARANLVARQHWHWGEDGPAAVTVSGFEIAADDPRLAFLDIRRDAAGRPWPAAFACSPATGEALPADPPAAPPRPLRFADAQPLDGPLPGADPRLRVAGRPRALYLFDAALGSLDWRDERAGAWLPLGRLPPAVHGPCAGPDGLAYAAADGLVLVPLPQLGPTLRHAAVPTPGLALLGPPAATPEGLAVPVRGAGRLGVAHLPLRGGLPAGPPVVHDAAGPADGPAGDSEIFAGPEVFAEPVVNRLGDIVWPGTQGFLAAPAEGPPQVAPWPEGFAPLLAQAPFRDRAEVFHQLGTSGGRYHYAAMDRGTPTLRPLDGPHAAAGAATYRGGERHDVPWAGPAEAPTLGPYAGALLLPLLALPGDTILLALRVEAVGAFLRGERLARPVVGHLLHHAHGVGLRRLPASLEVGGLGDAAALVHGHALYCTSRLEGRCLHLGLAAA